MTSEWYSKFPYSVSEIHDGEDLWEWSRLGIRLNVFRWSTIPQKQIIIIIIIINAWSIISTLKTKLSKNFKCKSCNAEYIGKTKLHYRTQTSGHIGVSPLTGKYIKNYSQTSAVHDHILFCRAVVRPEDFWVHAKSSCNFETEIQESVFVKLLKSTLNKNIPSIPLCLLWYLLCNYILFREGVIWWDLFHW